MWGGWYLHEMSRFYEFVGHSKFLGGYMGMYEGAVSHADTLHYDEHLAAEGAYASFALDGGKTRLLPSDVYLMTRYLNGQCTQDEALAVRRCFKTSFHERIHSMGPQDTVEMAKRWTVDPKWGRAWNEGVTELAANVHLEEFLGHGIAGPGYNLRGSCDLRGLPDGHHSYPAETAAVRAVVEAAGGLTGRGFDAELRALVVDEGSEAALDAMVNRIVEAQCPGRPLRDRSLIASTMKDTIVKAFTDLQNGLDAMPATGSVSMWQMQRWIGRSKGQQAAARINHYMQLIGTPARQTRIKRVLAKGIPNHPRPHEAAQSRALE